MTHLRNTCTKSNRIDIFKIHVDRERWGLKVIENLTISDFEIRFMRPRFALACMSQSGSSLPPTLTHTPDIRSSNFSQSFKQVCVQSSATTNIALQTAWVQPCVS